MAKTIKRPAPAATAKKPGMRHPPDPRHERIFEMYRELGPARSFRKLLEAVQVRWPANPISLGALSTWSSKYDWKKRIEEYDRGVSEGVNQSQSQNPSPQANSGGGNDGEDDVKNLKQAASKALARALQTANVAVTKPGDVKALIDMASKALELADKRENERSGVSTPQEIADFGMKMLKRIEEARRKASTTALIIVTMSAFCFSSSRLCNAITPIA